MTCKHYGYNMVNGRLICCQCGEPAPVKVLLEGDSHDAMPTNGVPANSWYRQLDTGKEFSWNGFRWIEQPGEISGKALEQAEDKMADKPEDKGGLHWPAARKRGRPVTRR